MGQLHIVTIFIPLFKQMPPDDSKLFHWLEMLMKWDRPLYHPLLSLSLMKQDCPWHTWWDGFFSFLSVSQSWFSCGLSWCRMRSSKYLTFWMAYQLWGKSWKIALQKQRLLLSEMYLFLFHILFLETISHSPKIINCCFCNFTLRCRLHGE